MSEIQNSVSWLIIWVHFQLHNCTCECGWSFLQAVSHARLVLRVNTDNSSNNGGASWAGFRFYTAFDVKCKEMKQPCRKSVGLGFTVHNGNWGNSSC